MMSPAKVMQQLKRAGIRPPGVLTLAITGACNLVCSHCWVTAGEPSSHAHVPLRTVCRVLEDFALIGGTGLRITGGEPLCHPHWLEIVRISGTLGFRSVTLQTNAMLLKEKRLAELIGSDFDGLAFQVSLDGASAGVHDLVRGNGAFDGALQGIGGLVQAGLAARVSIFFTEMRHNLGDIPALLDLADRLGLGSVATGALVQCGRASKASRIAPPEPEQYMKLLERYDDDVRFREMYRRIGSVAALEWRAGDIIREGCCSFIENPYLTPSGRLYPCLLCHADEFSVTGVFEMGFIAALAEGIPLWSSLLGISRNRAGDIPECRDCRWKAYCEGGCMGRAWGSRGDLLAADDRCGTRRAMYQRANKSRWQA